MCHSEGEETEAGRVDMGAYSPAQCHCVRLGTEALLHLERNSKKIPSFPELLEDLSRLMWG